MKTALSMLVIVFSLVITPLAYMEAIGLSLDIGSNRYGKPGVGFPVGSPDYYYDDPYYDYDYDYYDDYNNGYYYRY